MAESFVEQVVASVRHWFCMEVPNRTARLMIADLETIIADFEAVRDRGRFEDEPCDFEVALQESKERT